MAEPMDAQVQEIAVFEFEHPHLPPDAPEIELFQMAAHDPFVPGQRLFRIITMKPWHDEWLVTKPAKVQALLGKQNYASVDRSRCLGRDNSAQDSYNRFMNTPKKCGRMTLDSDKVLALSIEKVPPNRLHAAPVVIISNLKLRYVNMFHCNLEHSQMSLPEKEHLLASPNAHLVPIQKMQ